MKLGVSRIPVREALRTLSSEGLVILQPGKGASIVELDKRDMADLYDLRLRLEPPLAGEIIDNISPLETRTLQHMAEEMEKTDDRDHWSTLNLGFHERMYCVVDRPHTIRVVLQVMELVEPYSRVYVHVLSGINRASHEHSVMVDALDAGDPAALEEEIRQHLLGARDGLLAAAEEVWRQGPGLAPGAQETLDDR
jgi:DNA-binding GntR family transcriptional regulator